MSYLTKEQLAEAIKQSTQEKLTPEQKEKLLDLDKKIETIIKSPLAYTKWQSISF